jgi:hypothetical protein
MIRSDTPVAPADTPPGVNPAAAPRPRGVRVAARTAATETRTRSVSMRSTRRYLLPATLLLATLAYGCDRAPTGVPGDRLAFIRVADGAPALEAQEVSFWAVKGENREVEIRYQPLPGETEGERCLRFRVRDDALLRDADGRRFLEGDSVLITIRVVDYRHFHFEFQPAGLRFDPEEPAELRVAYQFADPDFNGDGVVDGRDEDFDFGFWRQERTGLPWRRIGSVRVHDLEEVRADLDGFTRYALAGGH